VDPAQVVFNLMSYWAYGSTVLRMSNLHFSGNHLFSNIGIKSDYAIRELTIVDSVFEDECKYLSLTILVINSDTSYFSILAPSTFNLQNVTFRNITYMDSIRHGTYIIDLMNVYIRSSTFNFTQFLNVTFEESDVNFLTVNSIQNVQSNPTPSLILF